MENIKKDIPEIIIKDDVIKEVIHRAAYQTSGFWGFNSHFYDDVIDGITERFGNKRFSGISLKKFKNHIDVSVYIIVTMEQNFLETAKLLQLNIKNALKLMLEIETKNINVNIEGVHFDMEGISNG